MRGQWTDKARTGPTLACERAMMNNEDRVSRIAGGTRTDANRSLRDSNIPRVAAIDHPTVAGRRRETHVPG